MTTNTKETSWKDEYCKKFGLCKSSGKCQCKAELRFISKLLTERDREYRPALVTKIDCRKEDVAVLEIEVPAGSFEIFYKLT